MTSAVLLLGGSIAVTLTLYWSAIFQVYGRADDYIYLHGVRSDELSTGLGAVWLNAGRPVPAVFYSWLLPRIGSVDQLDQLRLTSALVLAAGAAVAGLLALAVMGRHGWLERCLAVGIVVVVVTTTAAPSFVTWAVMAGQMPALTFAMLAGLCATGLRMRWRWALVALLILLSTFAYQHFAPLAFFASLLHSASLWARRQQMRWWDPVGVGVLVLAFLALNLGFVQWRNGSAMARISGPTPEQRIQWFTHEFLPRTVDLFVPWSMGGAARSALLVAVLLLLPLVRGPRYLVLPAAVVVSWFCTAAVIIPGELWASYRLVAAAQIALWVGAACCAAVGITELWQRKRVLGASFLTASVVALGLSSIESHHRALDYFASPNAADWAAVKCGLRQAQPVRAGQLIRQSGYDDSTSSVLNYDEYGIVGTSQPFAIQFEVWLALDAVDGPGMPRLDPSSFEVVLPTEDPTGALILTPVGCSQSDAATDRR